MYHDLGLAFIKCDSTGYADIFAFERSYVYCVGCLLTGDKDSERLVWICAVQIYEAVPGTGVMNIENLATNDCDFTSV